MSNSTEEAINEAMNNKIDSQKMDIYPKMLNSTQNDWIYESEAEMSRLLQQLEGMELISPKLRLDIEKICVKTNRATRADARREERQAQENMCNCHCDACIECYGKGM